MPSEVKPGISVATVSAVLHSKDNKHTLQVRQENVFFQWFTSCNLASFPPDIFTSCVVSRCLSLLQSLLARRGSVWWRSPQWHRPPNLCWVELCPWKFSWPRYKRWKKKTLQRSNMLRETLTHLTLQSSRITWDWYFPAGTDWVCLNVWACCCINFTPTLS